MYINGPNKAIFVRSEPFRRTSLGDGKDSILISYNMPVIGGSAGVGLGNPIGGNANAGSDLPLANTQTVTGTETTPTVDGSTVAITTGADTSTPQSSVSANTSLPRTVTSGAPLTTPASSTVPTPTSRMSSTRVPQPSVQVQQGPTTAAASTRGSTNTVESLPGAAIAGVVFGVLFFALAIGVLVFRRWAIRKRSIRRQIWVSKPFVVSTTTTVLTDKPIASAATRDPGAAAGEAGASAGSSGNNNNNNLGATTVVPRFNLKIPRVKPPPLSLLSVPGPGYADLGSGLGSGSNVSFSAGRRLSSRSASPNSANSSLMVQMNSAPPTMYGALTNVGVVRCIFEPRLPDELRIRVGEALRVLAEYDDGWGLCENTRGERGMVPFECLDRGMEEGGERISIDGMARFASERLTMPAVSSTRNLRKSSLPALV
jgi:hypothetical protein